MGQNYYKPGDYSVICDKSGFKVKASECVLQWDGLYVLKRFHRERHPQDFVRGVSEEQSVPIPRPRQPDEFV